MQTVTPALALKENAGSDRSWVWSTPDFSEGHVSDEILAIRFANAESMLFYAIDSKQWIDAQAFKTEFEKAKELMKALIAAAPAPAEAETKTEEKAEEKPAEQPAQ